MRRTVHCCQARLDGDEHSVILRAVGTRNHSRPADGRFNGCYEIAHRG
jgi:hypothetical protein